MAGDTRSRGASDLREPLQHETVEHIGYRALVSLGLDASVADAVQLMQAKAVGCLVVVEAGTLHGIFTERDLVTRVLGRVDSLDVPLREYMTSDPVTVRVDEPVHRLLTRMYQHRVRHVAVVDTEERPVGTMSIKRAVHFVADRYPTAVFNVAPDPQSYPDTREGG